MANDNTEKPTYTTLAVLKTDSTSKIQIRRYDPMIQATTITTNGEGFNQLAGYIFGGNKRQESIAMTSPVQQKQTHEGWETAFMMPSKYSIESLPQPNDSSIELKRIPAKTVAVITFSGWANSNSVSQFNRELVSVLAKNGIKIISEPTINQYDDPWTRANMRTNEIQYEVIFNEKTSNNSLQAKPQEYVRSESNPLLH